MSKNQTEGGFFSHLTELRKRLIHSMIFLAVLFIICYYFSEYIYSFLVDPYAQAVKDDDINREINDIIDQKLSYLVENKIEKILDNKIPKLLKNYFDSK